MKKARQPAGAIPVTKEGKIILVSNKKQNFILPKGGLKKKEHFWQAALREAEEEAGVIGNISTKIAGNINGIPYYILYVTLLKENFDEKEKRKRIILSKDELLEENRIPEKNKKSN